MTNKGLLVVVSGPAGSGKGTVNKILLQREDFVFSVSATTRAPRPGEEHGVNYYYITHEEFEKRILNGEMLEYTTYCHNYYGTPKKEAEAVLESGKNLLLEIEVDGAMQVKKQYPDAILIMLLPPSFKVQEERLRGRGTEPDDVIKKRLEQARVEVETAHKYDYIVYNRDDMVEQCVEDIMTIIRAEKYASKRNPSVVENYYNN